MLRARFYTKVPCLPGLLFDLRTLACGGGSAIPCITARSPLPLNMSFTTPSFSTCCHDALVDSFREHLSPRTCGHLLHRHGKCNNNVYGHLTYPQYLLSPESWSPLIARTRRNCIPARPAASLSRAEQRLNRTARGD